MAIIRVPRERMIGSGMHRPYSTKWVIRGPPFSD